MDIGMTPDEKVAAFDTLVAALVHPFGKGGWVWWCPNTTGGTVRVEREEAVAELLQWAGDLVTFKTKTGTP